MTTPTSTSSSSTKVEAPKSAKAAPADAISTAEETSNNANAQEQARILANHERYEARISGKSSAEVNREQDDERRKSREEPEVAPGGGQTVPAYEATGEPAADATVEGEEE